MKPLEQQTCAATSVTPTADCPAADHLPSALTPQATPSSQTTNTEAFTHALAQLTSANLELGLALALVTASGHLDLNLIHQLRTRTRRDLIALFHKAARTSITADLLLTVAQQAQEASLLAEERDELVAGHQWCPGSVSLREFHALTTRLGDLASRIVAGHSKADRVGALFDQILTGVPVKAEPGIYSIWAKERTCQSQTVETNAGEDHEQISPQ
jgi:hypothetical protein